MLCKWSCTIKTHKKLGFVVARSIHSSVNHLNDGISMVLNRLLDPILRKLKHLCWSEDVQRLVLGAKVSSRTVMLKYDVK